MAQVCRLFPTLSEFYDFVDIAYRILLSHSKTRWLSLMLGVDKMLRTYPALQSYFLSTKESPKNSQNFLTDDFGELYFLLNHS